MTSIRFSASALSGARPRLAWFICFLLALALPAALRAATYAVPGTNITLTYSVSGSLATAEITDCNDNALGNVEIPATLGGVPVTSIGDFAFYNCSGLTSISLPADLTSIGDYAFYYCTGLTSISLPPSLTLIGDGAFYQCFSLTSILLPAGLTSIGDHVFYHCPSLTSITLPAGLTSIADYAFSFCTGLTSISLPAGLTSIGGYSFFGCSGLTSALFQGNAPMMGGDAFIATGTGFTVYYSPAASGFTTPTWEGYPAQPGPPGPPPVIDTHSVPGTNIVLTYRLSGSPATAEITDSNDNALGDLVIPPTLGGAPVTSIGFAAFYSCTRLTSITLPASLTSIGKSAFHRCSGLTSISLPAGLTSIGIDAFSNCSGLTAISVPPANAVYASANGVLFNKDFSTLIAVPGAYSGSYVVPSTVTIIGDSAFSFCTGLTSISLPDGLISIGVGAFNYCYGLTSITLPAGLTSISASAFYYCTRLTSISVHPANAAYASANGVLFNKAFDTLIAAPGALSGSYVVSSTVTTIGDYAFYYCTGLTSISLPAGLTSIGNGAFSSCTGLTRITLPASLTAIGNYAFIYCSGLTSITLPAGLIFIGDGAFYYCYGLTSARFQGKAPTMGPGVFEQTALGFTIYYRASATGFTTPAWRGYPAFPIAAPTESFAAWATAAGLSGLNAASAADPNADDVPNLLEYAFGTSPTAPISPAERPTVAFKTVGGQPALVLTHRRCVAALVTLTYEQSTDLANPLGWSPAALTPSVVDPDADGDGRVELVEVALPLSGAPRLFLRINASE